MSEPTRYRTFLGRRVYFEDRPRRPFRMTTLMLLVGLEVALAWMIWHEYTYRQTCDGLKEGCDYPLMGQISHGGADVILGVGSVMLAMVLVAWLHYVFTERGIK